MSQMFEPVEHDSAEIGSDWRYRALPACLVASDAPRSCGNYLIRAEEAPCRVLRRSFPPRFRLKPGFLFEPVEHLRDMGPKRPSEAVCGRRRVATQNRARTPRRTRDRDRHSSWRSSRRRRSGGDPAGGGELALQLAIQPAAASWRSSRRRSSRRRRSGGITPLPAAPLDGVPDKPSRPRLARLAGSGASHRMRSIRGPGSHSRSQARKRRRRA